MQPYLHSEIAAQHREDLLREAERSRTAALAREPHAWRHRLGEHLIVLGERLAERKPRARMA